MLFAIKIYKNGSMAKKVRTHKTRRFLKIPRSINWQDSAIKAYVKVVYGKFLDNHGRYVNFHNDGTYNNKADFWQAVNAFLED